MGQVRFQAPALTVGEWQLHMVHKRRAGCFHVDGAGRSVGQPALSDDGAFW